jgi:hypothetical protein
MANMCCQYAEVKLIAAHSYACRVSSVINMSWHLLKQPWGDAIILSRGAESEMCHLANAMSCQPAPIAAVDAVIY